MKSLLLTSVATALLTLVPAYAANAAEPAAPQKAAIGHWGVDTKGLSKTVKPGNDFYRYVNEASGVGLPFVDTYGRRCRAAEPTSVERTTS